MEWNLNEVWDSIDEEKPQKYEQTSIVLPSENRDTMLARLLISLYRISVCAATSAIIHLPWFSSDLSLSTDAQQDNRTSQGDTVVSWSPCLASRENKWREVASIGDKPNLRLRLN